jgi:hypothetical protein
MPEAGIIMGGPMRPGTGGGSIGRPHTQPGSGGGMPCRLYWGGAPARVGTGVSARGNGTAVPSPSAPQAAPAAVAGAAAAVASATPPMLDVAAMRSGCLRVGKPSSDVQLRVCIARLAERRHLKERSALRHIGRIAAAFVPGAPAALLARRPDPEMVLLEYGDKSVEEPVDSTCKVSLKT